MSKLRSQIEETLPEGMGIPDPLARLFSWIESQGSYLDRAGRRVGYLYPPTKLKAARTKPELPGGTQIAFSAEGNAHLKHWFGHNRKEVLDRLYVFAKTGSDGSMAAFWLDEQGRQRIVHLGSGSGSVLVCVLADDPVDFLRLLAIGYEEICWQSAYSKPPKADPDADYIVLPNVEYQDWVRSTFSVSIPATAAKIVKHPSEMGDARSKDDFCRWVEKNHD